FGDQRSGHLRHGLSDQGDRARPERAARLHRRAAAAAGRHSQCVDAAAILGRPVQTAAGAVRTAAIRRAEHSWCAALRRAALWFAAVWPSPGALPAAAVEPAAVWSTT